MAAMLTYFRLHAGFRAILTTFWMYSPPAEVDMASEGRKRDQLLVPYPLLKRW
jgi:hypothetical protein